MARENIEDSLKTIQANMDRLLIDAGILLASGRYQTATALAILAVEEAGKFFLVRWHLEEAQKARRRRVQKGRTAHRSKQAAIGSFYAAETAITAVRQFMRERGMSDDEATVSQFLYALHLPDENASRALDVLVEYTADKLMNSPDARIMSDAAAGAIEATKHRCLYVDIDDRGNIRSGPDEISKADADTWMARAVTARVAFALNPPLTENGQQKIK